MSKFLLNILFLCLILVQNGKGGRSRQNTKCKATWPVKGTPNGDILDNLASFSNDPANDPFKANGTYYEYFVNLDEQRWNISYGTGANSKFLYATGRGNAVLDCIDEKKQLDELPEVLFQEGRSFCISGEHFKNEETLTQYPPFLPLKELIEVNFDVGTHVRPDDYEQVNAFPWFVFDKDGRQPEYDFMKDPAYAKVYKWENTTESFFHTRLTLPIEKRNPPQNKPGPGQLHVLDVKGKEINETTRELPDKGYWNRPAVYESIRPDFSCRNPYIIDVREIEVEGVRLHNWLHITIYSKNDIHRLNNGQTNCATGKMRWIMLEVRDSLGLPVGDFNTDMPCGESHTACKCMEPKVLIEGQLVDCEKVHGKKMNSMPCMFTPLRAVTQPGIFLYGSPTYFTELHVSWHFAQHTSYFAKELHFVALVVENTEKSTYYTSRQTKYENPAKCVDIDRMVYWKGGGSCSPGSAYGSAGCCRLSKSWHFEWTERYPLLQNLPRVPGREFFESQADCDADRNKIKLDSDVILKTIQPGYYSFSLHHISDHERPYGWTPRYKALLPNPETTLGGWDYVNSADIELERLDCHKKVDHRFYDEKDWKQSKVPKRKNLFKWNSSYEVYLANDSVWGEHTIYNTSRAKELAESDSANFFSVYSLEDLYLDTVLENGTVAQVSRFYFGVSHTPEEYRDYQLPSEFSNLKTMHSTTMDERCACPVFGTTLDPDKITKSVQVLQGHSTHATQMLLAWVVLVPIALFVIRYYKETFMQVYLFHEFWWYSVHVLCLITALLFMIGGVLAIEYKRVDAINWNDETLAHVVIGLISCVLFAIHLLLGAFRFEDMTLRMIQISLHFGVGITEYALAGLAIVIAAWIPQGRMPCSALYTYLGFIVFQGLMHLFMEIHMRYVDDIMGLYPPRNYYPVPTVRVFHRNAPLSKFRIIVLAIYAALCWLFYISLRIAIQQSGASCFANLGNEYEPEIYENF